MGRAKKTTSSFSILAWPRGVFSWLVGTGRPALIILALFGMFGGGSYLAWMKLKSTILASPEYRIGPDNVEIPPPPPWIHHDIRADVFRDPRLDGSLSIMDDDLVDRIRNGFAQHAWVAKVAKVTKHFPALVRVDLTYRQPVCMVEAPGGGLFAIDAEGVVLPSDDFTSIEAARYPRLVGVKQRPSSEYGGRSTDARVIGAAEIAAALGQVWEIMRLNRIVPLEAGTESAASGNEPPRRSEPVFALFTHSETQIYWGHAPGANVVGELPAAEKVARLKKFFETYDSLDDPQHRQTQLDIRTIRGSDAR